MNYYLFRDTKGEVTSILATLGVMIVSEVTEKITQAQYETYKEFGMPETEFETYQAFGIKEIKPSRS